jgi:hypothetical protein
MIHLPCVYLGRILSPCKVLVSKLVSLTADQGLHVSSPCAHFTVVVVVVVLIRRRVVKIDFTKIDS